jgi:hypothetical protein
MFRQAMPDFWERRNTKPIPMKKFTLFLSVLLPVFVSMQLQGQLTNQPLAATLPVISHPNQPENITYQQYLQQNYQVQSTVTNWQNAGQSSRSTKSVGSGSGTIFREMAYRHDIWGTSNDWNNIDSAHYGYNTNGAVTAYNSSLSSQNNWNNFVSISYYYNKDGTTEMNCINQNWDAKAGNWVPVSKSTYTYDSESRCISVASSNWNSTGESWLLTNQFNYGYDLSGNKTSEVYQIWDSSSASWTNNFNYTYSYDGLGEMTGYVNQVWTSNNTWANSETVAYEFNANNNVIGKTTQIWSNGNWLNYDLGTWVFDAKNNVSVSASYVWLNGKWTNTSKSEYTYDAHNNNTLEVDYLWNTSSYQWDSSKYKAFVYNADNYPLSETEGVYINHVLTYTSKYQNIYNANDDKVSTTNYTWDKTTATWPVAGMVSYNYDANHNPTYQLNQTFNTTTATLQNTEQYYFYFISFRTTAIDETPNKLGASVYPNPSAQPQVNLQLNLTHNSEVLVTMYDAAGRPVNCELRQVNNGTNTIALNTSGLAAGNYLIQTVDRQDGKTSVLKFVKM